MVYSSAPNLKCIFALVPIQYVWENFNNKKDNFFVVDHSYVSKTKSKSKI